jgi:hypothetical protein
MAVRIQNGMMTPNEAREKDEMSAYPDGDRYYIAGNILPIGDQKTIRLKPVQPTEGAVE